MGQIIRVQTLKSEIDFTAKVDDIVSILYIGAITDNLQDLPLAAEEQENSGSDNLKTNIFSPIEIHVTGENILHKGVKLAASSVTRRLQFVEYKVEKTNNGKKLVITQHDPKTDLLVNSNYLLYDNTAAIRSWTTVTNQGKSAVGLEYVSSFSLTGIVQKGEYGDNWAERVEVSEPSNDWESEIQWDTQTLKEKGMNFWADGSHREASTKNVKMTNSGSWSCSEFSPNGILTNKFNNQAAMWQIEHNGSWHAEINDAGDGRLLQLGLFGPEELDGHWWKELQPKESFKSVPVAFVQMSGDKEDVIDEMTIYRRNIRRKNEDNRRLPVIFNDYKNCLSGDPTTAKELPLVDAAAKAGAEYFVIDAGWYADGYWWDSVGEWKPSTKRFPNGIREVTDKIRKLGMIPGLWLEIEVMGIHSKLAAELPDSWFFMRHGKRVIDVSRYHLDFRNSDVREYASSVVDRLVNEYGLGYIKMDYNITTGIGTDVDSDSNGDGLLEHNRAYLKWIDGLFVKYPNLIIENCGSGGMRHDYAMLSRHSIQSVTDQTQYVRNGQIAASCATVIAPEQAAIWSYPLINGDDEEAIYNMVNSMLLRIHQSGYLNKLTSNRFDMVAEGIKVYQSYCEEIPDCLPIWPTGFALLDDKFATFGLKNQDHIYFAVWNCQDQGQDVNVNFSKYGHSIEVNQIYPVNDQKVSVNVNRDKATFKFPKGKMARLYKITLKN